MAWCAMNLNKSVRSIGLHAVAGVSMVKYNLGLLAPLSLDNYIALAIDSGINGVGAFTEVEYYGIVIVGSAAQLAQFHRQVAADSAHLYCDGPGLGGQCCERHKSNQHDELCYPFHIFVSFFVVLDLIVSHVFNGIGR